VNIRNFKICIGRLLVGLALLLASAGNAQAQAIEQRLQRIERILDNSALIDMVQRMESLQNEVRALRGQLEQRENELASMRERQRKLYLDTDGRLQAIESGGGIAGGGLDDLSDLDNFNLDGSPIGGGASAGSEVTIDSQADSSAVQIPAVNSANEKNEYQNAYDLLILGRNLEAIAEFERFLQSYPNGTYSDNAHYWLGEANYVQRQYSQAIDRFDVVIFQFPASRKVPDARLRKGFALYELQRYAEARQELNQVEAEYRGRSIAALARRRIEQMNNAGL